MEDKEHCLRIELRQPHIACVSHAFAVFDRNPDGGMSCSGAEDHDRHSEWSHLLTSMFGHEQTNLAEGPRPTRHAAPANFGRLVIIAGEK